MKVREMPQMVVRLRPEQKKWLVGKAQREERSQTWLMMKIVDEAMQREQQQA